MKILALCVTAGLLAPFGLLFYRFVTWGPPSQAEVMTDAQKQAEKSIHKTVGDEGVGTARVSVRIYDAVGLTDTSLSGSTFSHVGGSDGSVFWRSRS
ncbi:MAG: hypothetical protein ACR2OZ_17870 [Verrucomicrobiales bacterium]